MNERPCPDDLLAAARSRGLSDLERKALSAHLARCELCRVGELAATLLREPSFAGRAAGDAAAAVAANDRALVERVAERASSALAKGARRGSPGWRRVAVGVVAFLGLGGVASAWIGRSWVAPRAADPAPASTGSFVRPRVLRRAGPSAPAPAPAPPARPLVTVKKHTPAQPAHDDTAAPAEIAASLFAEANGARRDGDLRGAVALYERLRLGFPGSAEARVSSISKGDLLVRLDEPGRALRAFDAYLAEVRTGPLREEALFGRARCLRMLGDGAGERDTWARLVRDFPSSAYGPVARQRLDELRVAR